MDAVVVTGAVVEVRAEGREVVALERLDERRAPRHTARGGASTPVYGDA